MTDAITSGLFTSHEHESASRRFARPMLAAICGVLAGVLTTSSLWRGVASGFPLEKAEDTWGILVWGDHYVWRSLASLGSGSVAAIIASAIARRRGGLLALVTVLPASTLWLVLAIWSRIPRLPFFFPERATLAYRISGGVLAVLLPWFAFVIGESVGASASSIAPHFDARKHTLLGIRWYQFLWLWLPIHIVLSQSAWVLVRFSGFIKATWLSSGLAAIVPTLFVGVVLASFELTLTGAERAYLLLAGFARAANFGRNVMKYALGYPLLAIIIQTVLSLAYWGLAKLFTRLLG